MNKTKKTIFFLATALFLLFGIGKFCLAEPIEINFFYSNFCPHCSQEKIFLDNLNEKYPEIKINRYEIINVLENQKLLDDFYENYEVSNSEIGLIPVTFLPERYFVGFSEQIGKEIEICLKDCFSQGEIFQIITVPFLGNIDISKMSLPVLTISLGAVDGLNPCAMWVLIFLIALLINTRSRKRMWLIGGTFVAASGVVYYLILAAWLNLFLAISYVSLTRMIIGIFALTVGVWQIKNFITYHPGVCKIIGIKSKIETRFKEKAEKIVNSPFSLGVIGGLIFLAFGVNLIEFFCSAGIPAIYTRILALSDLPALTYYFYLLLYTIAFMIDDVIIFSLAIITLSKISTAEKYSYWATLIGGLLILILGLLLIFKPEILMFV